MLKRKFFIGVCWVVCMCATVFGLTACDSTGITNNDDKQVPVYQGMTVSTERIESLEIATKGYSLAKKGSFGLYNNKDNGNHYGHYKGDYNGKDENIDKENPFPDNNDNETIENEIEDVLSVEGAMHTIYYAEPNEDIYIHIHIKNPDDFEILSFTLNDKKYSSYMFEEGSDMETLILKYNVGECSGIVDYTIDAIKYVDGTDIKDVKMDGDKTVEVGVQIENQIQTTVSNMTVGINDLSLDIEIQDEDGLIEYSAGQINTVLYDGETIVETKNLTVGANQVSFENLQANTLYQYAIVGHYDNLEGDGFGVNILYKEAFYTQAVVLFDEIVVGQEEIAFNLVWNSSISNKTLTALKLYSGEMLVTTLDTTVLTVNELLSGCDYTLVAEFDYLSNIENISIDFTTLIKQVPSIEIVEVDKTSEMIRFDIIEMDVDNICDIVRIDVLHENKAPIVIDDLKTRVVENLTAGEFYTIKVYYTYDLNDGNGRVESNIEITIKTKGLGVPMKEGTCIILNGYGFYHNTTLNNYYEHKGIDFGAEAGTEVYAFEDGVVESIYKDDILLGTEIVVDHGNGLKTLYRFVEEVGNIKVGDSVVRGQLIATVAEATGNEYKDGPHLHFEILENGQAVDPMKYLDAK